MKNTIYCILFLFVTFFGYSQEKQLLQTGVIIDSVKIAAAPTESYAIYFPKKYNAQIPSLSRPEKKFTSLGQITAALFEVGGQYRRNM